MNTPLRQSKYLRVKDGYFRMFVRWLYQKVLDEPFIPDGVSVHISRYNYLHKDKEGKIDAVKLSWAQKFPQRRGMLEEYIFSNFNKITEVEIKS